MTNYLDCATQSVKPSQIVDKCHFKSGTFVQTMSSSLIAGTIVVYQMSPK